jgi:hypothetical protein
MNYIYNLGCMFYISGLVLGLFLVASILTGVQRVVKSRRLENLRSLMWHHLTPDILIRLFFELNFELAICSYL